MQSQLRHDLVLWAIEGGRVTGIRADVGIGRGWKTGLPPTRGLATCWISEDAVGTLPSLDMGSYLLPTAPLNDE